MDIISVSDATDDEERNFVVFTQRPLATSTPKKVEPSIGKLGDGRLPVARKLLPEFEEASAPQLLGTVVEDENFSMETQVSTPKSWVSENAESGFDDDPVMRGHCGEDILADCVMDEPIEMTPGVQPPLLKLVKRDWHQPEKQRVDAVAEASDVIEHPRSSHPMANPPNFNQAGPSRSTADDAASEYDTMAVLNNFKPKQLPQLQHWQLEVGRSYPAHTIKRVKGKHSTCYVLESDKFMTFLPSYYNTARINPYVPARRFTKVGVSTVGSSGGRVQPLYQFS